MTSPKNDDTDDEKDVSCDLISGQTATSHSENSAKLSRQVLAVSSPILGSLCIGLSNGFTAVLVPKMNNVVDLDAGSWLAGTVVLSILFGNISSSFTMRFFGRKKTLLFSFVPNIIGWIYISFGTNFGTLLLSSTFIGFGSGVNVAVGQVYYAETCEPKLRGLFSGLMVSSVSAGILIIHLLGITLDWRIASQISAALPVAGFLLTLFVPESPAWLLANGQTAKAAENFFWLRGCGLAAHAEFDALSSRQMMNSESNWSTVLKSLASKQFFRPFSILVFLFSVQQWSGLNVIIFHAIIMLQKISSKINANGCTILIDLLRVASAIGGTYLLRTLRRRDLYFISATATLASMIGIIVASKYDLSLAFMVTALCCYICAMHSGIVIMPWLMNSELYPITIRDAGIVVSTVYPFLLQFIMVKTGLPMISYLGIPTTMSIYATVVFIGTVILYFIMPETKDKTLQEVGDKFRKS